MLKFLIIIPAYNEEDFIDLSLKSLLQQTYDNFEIRIVNDGSTDKTLKIISEIHDQRITVINLEKSQHAPGSKVVKAFYKGLHNSDCSFADIICKFDADIIFPEDYLERIAGEFIKNPHAGMVSGLVKISKKPFSRNDAFNFTDKDNDWKFEDISSKNHIRGPIKSYSKKCFVEIGGLKPVLGWDNIDVMLTQMHGYEIITIKNLWVKHLRPTGNQYQKSKAKKMGEYFYNIGLNAPLAAISSLKFSFKNRSIFEFFITMNSFLHQKHPSVLSKEERDYVQKLRWKKMKKMFRR